MLLDKHTFHWWCANQQLLGATL